MDTKLTGATAANLSKTAARRLAVALSLLAVTLSGCAVEVAGTSSPQGTATQAASQATSTTPPAGNGDGYSGAPQAGSGGERSSFKAPAGAVESFVTQILRERYKEACVASAPNEIPERKIEARCDTPQAKKVLASLHDAWAKPGVKLPPEAKVEVTNVTKDGNTARVLDSEVTLDGRTLRELELIGSTGNTTSFNITIKLRKHAKTWQVSGLDISA